LRENGLTCGFTHCLLKRPSKEFLHMGVPPLKKREREALNLGESRLNLPANPLRSLKQ
jgi:hypothetical protein